MASEEPKPASPKGSTTPRKKEESVKYVSKVTPIPATRVPTTPRATIPTPVDAPIPTPVLRYAAAAAISIPKTSEPEQGIHLCYTVLIFPL